MNWYFQVWRKFADFDGRATRAEYWSFALINLLVTFLLRVVDVMIGYYDVESGTGAISGLYTIAVIIPGLAVGARRLHDIGRSGWWQLIALIPIIGIIALFIMFMIDSKEDNEYGSNPKQQVDDKKPVAD